MTTQPHEIQPRETDGKFGVKHLREVPQIVLAVPDDAATERLSGARDTVEMLVTRATEGGGYTDAWRQDDVEEDLRSHLTAVDEETFKAGFVLIAENAEKVSILEHCYDDPNDTEAYQGLMDDAGIEPVLLEDRSFHEPLEDWQATHAAVLEHYDTELGAATWSLWDADRKARS